MDFIRLASTPVNRINSRSADKSVLSLLLLGLSLNPHESILVEPVEYRERSAEGEACDHGSTVEDARHYVSKFETRVGNVDHDAREGDDGDVDVEEVPSPAI